MTQKRPSLGSNEVIELSMNPPKRLKLDNDKNNTGLCIIDLEQNKVNFKNNNFFNHTNPYFYA
jgi:hypothetical protein